MRTMKAVRIHAYGGPETLIYEDAPLPDVRMDEVLIRVHAVAVNPFDWKVREGYVANWFNHTLPLIVGWDVSGTIEVVGASATGVQAGDAVLRLDRRSAGWSLRGVCRRARCRCRRQTPVS